MTVENETGVPLKVIIDRQVSAQSAIEPGTQERMVVGSDAGDCMLHTMFVVDEEGGRISRFGPPVCDEDVWVVREADLRAPTDQEIRECLGEDLGGVGRGQVWTGDPAPMPCTEFE